MNPSIILNCQDVSSNVGKRLYIFQRNDSVFIGKDFYASHAIILFFLWNSEVFSAPMKAWKKGNDAENSVGIFINVSFLS